MGGLYGEVSKNVMPASKDKDAVAGKPRFLTGYGLKSEKKGNGFPSIPSVQPGDRIRSNE